MTGNPKLFWGLVASMWIGNLMLVILNLPLIGIWIQFLEGTLSTSVSRYCVVLRDRGILHQQQHL